MSLLFLNIFSLLLNYLKHKKNKPKYKILVTFNDKTYINIWVCKEEVKRIIKKSF